MLQPSVFVLEKRLKKIDKLLRTTKLTIDNSPKIADLESEKAEILHQISYRIEGCSFYHLAKKLKETKSLNVTETVLRNLLPLINKQGIKISKRKIVSLKQSDC